MNLSKMVKEHLAKYAHQAWSDWMIYLFEKSTKNDDGTVTIPVWAVKRWQRQAQTPYDELPEIEKESDRSEALDILNVLNKV